MLRPEWPHYFCFYLGRPCRRCPKKTFKVSAQITAGCALGAGAAPKRRTSHAEFWHLSSLYSNVDVASTAGAGSIIVTCRPAPLFQSPSTMASTAAQPLSATCRTATAARWRTSFIRTPTALNVWGSSTLALNVASFPSTTQTYTVYGRLFATNGFPAVGSLYRHGHRHADLLDNSQVNYDSL